MCETRVQQGRPEYLGKQNEVFDKAIATANDSLDIEARIGPTAKDSLDIEAWIEEAKSDVREWAEARAQHGITRPKGLGEPLNQWARGFKPLEMKEMEVQTHYYAKLLDEKATGNMQDDAAQASEKSRGEANEWCEKQRNVFQERYKEQAGTQRKPRKRARVGDS